MNGMLARSRMVFGAMFVGLIARRLTGYEYMAIQQEAAHATDTQL